MKKNQIRKKVLASVISAAMILNLTPALAFAGENGAAAIPAAQQQEAQQPAYVWMNIPYEDFYKEDLNNTVKVDAFTSATLNKSRTGTMVGGSYHVDKTGKDISGVTFPVKVGAGVDLSKYKQVTDQDSVTITVTNRGQTSDTTYTGKDALFENEDYAWYAMGSEAPEIYKEATLENGKLVFGKIQGSALNSKTTYTAEQAGAEFTTESGYGDYQLNLSELGVSNDTHKIYGVIITTGSGSYGLRHMENIWRGTELSWCTGFTTAVHNCPTDSEHYKKMMGETIKAVTYYTDKGVYEIAMNQYVPIKFRSELRVKDASVTSGQAEVTVGALPSGFSPKYSVEGLQGVDVKDGKLTYTAAGAEKGDYILTVKDASGVYADIHTDFALYTEDMPAAYDAAKVSLKPADGFAAEDLTAYVKDIKSVTVNGTAYAASGKHSVKLINEDGSLIADAEPIKASGTYQIKVAAAGYKELSFTYVNDGAAAPAEGFTASLSRTSYTYNGKVQKPELSVKDSRGNAISDYQAVWPKNSKNAGVYTVKVTVGTGKNAVSKSLTYTIKKAAQTITKVKTSASFKSSALKKKAGSFKIGAKAVGKLTYKKASGNKKITVSSSGTVTVKKGLKKGTYKVNVKISAAKTANYNAKTVTKKLTIKVK